MCFFLHTQQMVTAMMRERNRRQRTAIMTKNKASLKNESGREGGREGRREGGREGRREGGREGGRGGKEGGREGGREGRGTCTCR